MEAMQEIFVDDVVEAARRISRMLGCSALEALTGAGLAVLAAELHERGGEVANEIAGIELAMPSSDT